PDTEVFDGPDRFVQVLQGLVHDFRGHLVRSSLLGPAISGHFCRAKRATQFIAAWRLTILSIWCEKDARKRPCAAKIRRPMGRMEGPDAVWRTLPLFGPARGGLVGAQ